MTKSKSSIPPFAWLGRFWTPAALSFVLSVAAFFRFYKLADLPPGLDEASARAGLQALGVNAGHLLPALSPDSGYAPLWVWLQALSIQIFGHTALALRLWPALLGVLAVAAVWLWLRDWFNLPIAWIGSMALAVSPWAVTVSRSGLESALLPLLVPLTLWLLLRATRKFSAGRAAALAIVIVTDLLSGPLGWLLALAVLILGVVQLLRRRPVPTYTRLHAISLVIVAIGASATTYSAVTSWDSLKAMPQTLGIAHSFADLLHNALRVLLMFNVRGDENYRHNLSGEPMLNAFFGLMMVAGLLVAISRLHALRYRVLLAFTFILLAPAVLATPGVPNSSWAIAALPLLIGLAAIGTYYMLELWYATFPINSAARATGQAAIILLLGLSLVQGYTQYFGAWAQSTAVHLAYNEGTVAIARSIETSKFAGERLVVVAADQQPVLAYLGHGSNKARILRPADVSALPIATGARQFYIGDGQREETAKILKAKFPGGTLKPHYSDFNALEIYYTYEVAK